VAKPDEIDRVSTSGYALGYVGGGLLLALNLAWIQKPQWFGLPSGPGLSDAAATLPARLAFLSVAVWWLLFSIPLFRHVPEPAATAPRSDLAPVEGRNRGRGLLGGFFGVPRAAFARLREAFRDLCGYRQAAVLLIAFLIYNDGIGTIIRMAAIYGTEIGIGRGALIGSILVVQFVGIPCSFIFGGLAGRIGAKRSIHLGLCVYGVISVLGYFMTTAWHFFVLASLVGMVQGGTQALSRSLFASMIPRSRSAEFFGFWAVVEKFAGIFGPGLFALAIVLTGSSRIAILSVIAFFLAGGILLHFVDVERGRREAQARP
jgi:UMF1 family MFS transporter